MDIQQLGDLKTELGECPVWHGQQLWLLDCRAGVIYALDPDTGAITARHEVPPPLGCFAFNRDGRIVLALKEAIAMLDPGNGQLRTLARLDVSHPDLRLNDVRSRNNPGSNVVCFLTAFYDGCKCSEVLYTTICTAPNKYVVYFLAQHGLIFMKAHVIQ